MGATYDAADNNYTIGLLLLAGHRAARIRGTRRCACTPTRTSARSPARSPAHDERPHPGSAGRSRSCSCAAAGSSPAVSLGRPADGDQDRRPGGRRVLPGPVEPRQGGPLHPRRELHRLVLVEGVRQGRHHHLGDPGDRLPVGGPGPARVRAARLPARRRVLLVHLLADPGALPLRPRRAGRDVPGGQGPAGRPGAGLGRHPGRPGAPPALPAGPRQGRAGAGRAGTRPPRSIAAAHVHTIKPVRAGPGRRLLADPGDVDGVASRPGPGSSS